MYTCMTLFNIQKETYYCNSDCMCCVTGMFLHLKVHARISVKCLNDGNKSSDKFLCFMQSGK